MALDPEQLQQRRLAREQKRKKARRRLIVRLISAVFALSLAGLAVYLLTRPPQPATEATLSPVVTPSDPSDPSAAQSLQDTVIHFVTSGDLNINDKVVASGGAAFDYTNALLDVAYLFANADLAAINLEGNLCGSPYGTATGSAPQSLAMALSRMGVDIIQLANSYAINRGLGGLSSTIDSVRAAGMEPVGVYKNEEEFQKSRGYSIFTVQGIKIAVVAFTKGMDGMTLPPGSENCVNLLYTDYDSTYQRVDTQRISAIMDAANQENPDLVIAMVHWGSEFNDNISNTQYNICNLLKQKGADVIIGTHSHYLEKLEFDEENGTFVAYGLGDFFSDASRAGSQYGIVLDLEITKFHTGQTKVTGYSFTPIYSLSQADGPLRVVRIHEAMRAYENSNLNSITREIYDDMAYSLWRIQARTDGE